MDERLQRSAMKDLNFSSRKCFPNFYVFAESGIKTTRFRALMPAALSLQVFKKCFKKSSFLRRGRIVSSGVIASQAVVKGFRNGLRISLKMSACFERGRKRPRICFLCNNPFSCRHFFIGSEARISFFDFTDKDRFTNERGRELLYRINIRGLRRYSFF